MRALFVFLVLSLCVAGGCRDEDNERRQHRKQFSERQSPGQVAVPEPSTYALFGLGAAALVVYSRMRRK